MIQDKHVTTAQPQQSESAEHTIHIHKARAEHVPNMCRACAGHVPGHLTQNQKPESAHQTQNAPANINNKQHVPEKCRRSAGEVPDKCRRHTSTTITNQEHKIAQTTTTIQMKTSHDAAKKNKMTHPTGCCWYNNNHHCDGVMHTTTKQTVPVPH